MKFENGKETPVTISIGLAMSNEDDISLSQCKGTFDGRYVVHDSHTIDTMTMELAEAESDYMTWSRSLPEGGICIVTIREDRTTACVTGLDGEYEAIQIGRGKRQFLLLPVTKVGRIEYAGRFTRNNRG